MNKGLRMLTTITGFLFLMCFMAWAQTPSMGAGPGMSTAPGGKLSSSDEQFVIKAAEGGKSEVELGQLAEQKGHSQEVKDFGKRMVTDHTKAGEKLKEIAQQKGLSVPDKMDSESAALKRKLDKLSGAEFDKTYMDAMVKDHEKDVAEFKKEASMAKDPAIKGFAEQTLPTLEEHLKLAKQIDSKENQRASR